MSLPAGVYDAFRENGAPTYYGPNQTAFMTDVLEAGLIFAFIILAISFYVVLPGIRGKERIFAFIRITSFLFIGAVILLTNFTYDWEVSEIEDLTTKYKAGSKADIHADVAVHIGLRGINITLKGTPEIQSVDNLNETINYNEHFDWRWEQGRFGFGIFAGRFNREFRAAQFRGLPLPILWIAEYFTFDGEGIRWGRHYRQAGWYAHIMMWLALPLWFLTVILFYVLLRYGACMLMLTGAVMVSANIIWASVRNFNELMIPFTDTKILVFTYGGSFWLNLIVGIICIILGLIIYVMDLRYPTVISSFFGVDVLQDLDEVQEEEINTQKSDKGSMEMDEMPGPSANGHRAAAPVPAEDDDDEDDDEIYEPPMFHVQQQEQRQDDHYQKRKSRNLTKRWQAPRRRPPPPIPGEESPDEIYENAAFNRV
ncbi:dual oxidase maturation factor 1-like [Mizuhopecten yessoensis]|nr:dual oxidase maturation factor 1-like [Mizuhopecten yessoensis]XP_021359873.1 dual oxidase maturation factor 1-like [Mizuhopecten yessoensis]